MSNDGRRDHLLSAGVELLKKRPYQEVSIEEIARAAGVSKGLLYHYFPTKRDFIVAALRRGSIEMAKLLAPDPELAPIKRLDASLDAYLDFVEEHSAAFAAIFRGGSEDPGITKTLDAGRDEQLATLMAAIGEWDEAPVSTEATPELEAAVFANWADLLLASSSSRFRHVANHQL
jgi:AcrR family transcriptional regulator